MLKLKNAKKLQMLKSNFLVPADAKKLGNAKKSDAKKSKMLKSQMHSHFLAPTDAKTL